MLRTNSPPPSPLPTFAAGQEAVFIERDFDRDGAADRIVVRGEGAEIQSRKADTKAWAKADFQLPDGVVPGEALRFLDLNGDGFDDVLFSAADRFAIHLWSTRVAPHLGWGKGWSQTVRAGKRRTRAGRTASARRRGSPDRGRRPGGETRWSRAALRLEATDRL
ncbi:MAG: VCBS repeat-containing protein [Verrucomicrobiales bacterium]